MRARSLVVLLACACAGAPAGPASTTADVTSSSGDGDSRFTGELPAPTTGTTTGTTGDPALPSAGYTCDPRAQDCPTGSRCTPFSSVMGDDWDGARCVPIAPNPAGLGEPCVTEQHALSGIDDCGPGLLCWYFAGVGDLRGRCLGLCGEGDTCVDPEAVCYQSSKPSFLCYALCDPLAQDCPPPATLCVRSTSVDGFMCRYDPAGAPAEAGMPCASETDCAPAHLCDPADLVSGCAAERCCAPLCSLSQPACPPALPHCVPHDDDPRERYLDVGVCRAP